MESIRNFIAVMLGVAIFLLTASLMPQHAASAEDKKASRAFYLTTTTHTGAQATTACAAGFHMASLWEIFDPSNLRYDATVGATADDSGAGPPFLGGWVRTGTPALDVFMVSESGKATVLKAGAQWEILAVNDLDEEVWATPAIASATISIRMRSALYAFATRRRNH